MARQYQPRSAAPLPSSAFTLALALLVGAALLGATGALLGRRGQGPEARPAGRAAVAPAATDTQQRQAAAAPVAVRLVEEGAPAPIRAGTGFVEQLPGEMPLASVPAAPAGSGLGFREFLPGEQPSVTTVPLRPATGVGDREFLEGEEPSPQVSTTPAEREPAPLIGDLP